MVGKIHKGPLIVAGAVGAAILLLSNEAEASSSDQSMPSGSSPSTSASTPIVTHRFAPNAPETVALFASAAQHVGLPVEWGSDAGLHSILDKESQGYVGRPNYQFGNVSLPQHADKWPAIWAGLRDGTWVMMLDKHRVKKAGPSSASGLGQLTLQNISTGKFYPSGVNGIGVALEEAIGMLRYIKQRYKTPAAAWERYNSGHEGY